MHDAAIFLEFLGIATEEGEELFVLHEYRRLHMANISPNCPINRLGMSNAVQKGKKALEKMINIDNNNKIQTTVYGYRIYEFISYLQH